MIALCDAVGRVPAEARLVGDTIVVVGSTVVTFSDFRVGTSASVVTSVEDDGVTDLQLFLRRT